MESIAQTELEVIAQSDTSDNPDSSDSYDEIDKLFDEIFNESEEEG